MAMTSATPMDKHDQLERDRQAHEDVRQDGAPVRIDAPSPLHELAEPDPVLHDHRSIEPVASRILTASSSV